MSCKSGFALCAPLRYCLSDFFLAIRWFWTASISVRIEGLPGHGIILLCRTSLDEGIFRALGCGLQI